MSPRKALVVPLAWAVLALATLSFALPQIDELGLYYDEAFLAQQARGFVEPDRAGVHPSSVRTLWVAGRPFPVRNAAYLGSLKSQLLIPSLALFGSSPFVLRVSTLSTGLLGLLFFMLFARRMFGEPTAVVTGLLIASDPSFFLFSQFEWGPFTSMLLCRCMGLYFLAWAFSPERPRSAGFAAIVGGACMGLGIYSRVDFAVIPVALAIGMLGFRRDALAAAWQEDRVKIASATTAFILAASPAIAVIGEIVSAGSAIANRGGLGYRMDVFASVLDGSHFFRLIRAGGRFDALFAQDAPANGFLLIVCVSAVILSLPALRKPSQQPGSVGFLVLTTAAVAGLMLSIPGAVRAHHMLNLLPLPHLIVAAAGIGIWQHRWASERNRLLARICIAVTLGTCLYSNAVIVSKTQELIRDTGGKGRFSVALQNFAMEVDAGPDAESIELVSLDWGFHEPLLFTTRNVKLREPIWALTSPTIVRAPYIANGGSRTIYLIHEEPYDLFGLGSPFLKALGASGTEHYRVREHLDGTGELAFKSIRLEHPHQLRFDGRFRFRLLEAEPSRPVPAGLQ
jgi:hypothetical protein